MNITKLTINQVAKLWDSIRYGIIEAFSSSSIVPDGQMLQTILYQLLKEELQCWCIYSDEKTVYGHMITSIVTDMTRKSLLVYSEYLFNRLPSREAYVEVADKIEQFAKANACHSVIGYSADPNAISMAEKLGFSSDQRVLVKEVT